MNEFITFTTIPGRYEGDFTEVKVSVSREDFARKVEEQSNREISDSKWFLENPSNTIEYHARVTSYLRRDKDPNGCNIIALMRADYEENMVALETVELIASSRLIQPEYADIVDEINEALELYRSK